MSLVTVVLLAQLASDPVPISRIGYRATKAATAGAVTFAAREAGLSSTAAAVTGALLGPTVGHTVYLLRGQPGGRWPSAGFAARDFASEVAWGSWPMWLLWAKRGAWYRWPLAALGYGTTIALTWSWSVP